MGSLKKLLEQQQKNVFQERLGQKFTALRSSSNAARRRIPVRNGEIEQASPSENSHQMY
jgi:hypothetical protein